MTGFTPTAGQAKTLKGLRALRSRAATTGRIFGPVTVVLKGPAGTGKTWLINEFLRDCVASFESPETMIKVVAPTHKAASVLQQKMASADIDLRVTTVAKLLHLRPTRCGESGKKVFKQDPQKPPKLSPYLQVLIFDELSMIGKETMELIEQYCSSNYYTSHRNQLLVIGVGDPSQLEPVGEEPNEYFAAAEHKYELTEVVRHDGGVLDLATTIRTREQIPLIRTNKGGTTSVEVYGPKNWQKEWLKALDENFGALNADLKCLCHRNETRSALNKLARDHLFGEGAPPFQHGESLVVSDVVMAQDEDAVVAGAGTEFGILTCSQAFESLDGVTLPIYNVSGILPDVKDEKGDVVTVEFESLDPAFNAEFAEIVEAKRKVAQQFQRDFKKGLTRDDDTRRALWREYFHLEERFTLLEPGFCLTVHKSQGSTYKTVFIDQDDIESAPNKADRWRLTYVALTRASERAVFLLK